MRTFCIRWGLFEKYIIYDQKKKKKKVGKDEGEVSKTYRLIFKYVKIGYSKLYSFFILNDMHCKKKKYYILKINFGPIVIIFSESFCHCF